MRLSMERPSGLWSRHHIAKRHKISSGNRRQSAKLTDARIARSTRVQLSVQIHHDMIAGMASHHTGFCGGGLFVVFLEHTFGMLRVAMLGKGTRARVMKHHLLNSRRAVSCSPRRRCRCTYLWQVVGELSPFAAAVWAGSHRG